MRRPHFALLVLSGGLVVAPASAVDHGLPLLNSAGRYLGVGWSHHSYHSNVSGRSEVLDRAHPASDYPSRCLHHHNADSFSYYPTPGLNHSPSAPYLTPPATLGLGSHPIMNGASAAESVPQSVEPLRPSVDDSRTDPSFPTVPESFVLSSSRLNHSFPKASEPTPSLFAPVLESSTVIVPEEIEEQSGLIELEPSPSDQSKSLDKSGLCPNRNRYIYR